MLNEDQINVIVSRYLNGDRTYLIAKEFSVSESTVHRHLRKRGISRRSNNAANSLKGRRVWTESKQVQAEKFRAQGWSYPQISRELGVDSSTVRNHLDPIAGLHSTWSKIKSRCYDPQYWSYRYYGDRGIKLHEAWIDDYRVFAQDILLSLGDRPSPRYSLDRIDNDGHYEPGNLRWALPRQQALNRSSSKSPWDNISVSKPKVFENKKSPVLLKIILSKVFMTEKDANLCAKELNDKFGSVIVDIAEFLEAWVENSEDV